MMHLWQNYSHENKFYAAVNPWSPYIEASYVHGNNIGINPLLRFSEVFSYIYQGKTEYDIKNFPLENSLFHYLALMDLKTGLHLSSIREYILGEELVAGNYGQTAKKLYESLSEYDQRVILVYLRRHESADGRYSIFFNALNAFFPDSQIYFNTFERKFLICVQFSEIEYNLNLMELLRILFLDIDVRIEVFWNQNPGIIGDDQTMRIDDFIIY